MVAPAARPRSWRASFSGSREGARADHDLVFADQRGSGRSNGLGCTAFAEPDLARLYPRDKVRACREELARRADLTQYNTANSVEDLGSAPERAWLRKDQVLWSVLRHTPGASLSAPLSSPS